MVSLRGQSISSVMETGRSVSMNTETGTTSMTNTAPPSNFTSVTTKKQTTSKGEVVTTVTTTTTTVSSSTSSASSNTASSTTTASGATSSTNTATDGSAGNVSIAINTTMQSENGSSPITTVTTDNGVNSTSTSTTKDAVTGITTVTTKTDSEMNGSASSSTKSANTAERSVGTSQETSSAASALVSSTSTITASSSAGATVEGTLTSITNTGSTTEGNSVSSTSTSGATTNEAGAITTTGSANNYYNSAATTTSSSTSNAATSDANENSSVTSTATSTSSSTGSKESITTTEGSATGTSATSTATSSEGSTSSSTTLLSSSMVTSSSNSSSSSSSSSSLENWFISNFRDDETQLVVGVKSSITTAGASHQVCDGLPALVTRSSTETPNGGCPDELTALNASCTCITGYSATASSWAFHVTTESWNSTTTTTTRSLTQSSSDELAINTIRPIWVSSSLETLEIEGAGDSLAEITFIDENRVASGSSLTLVRSASNSSNISTLALSNLNLNSVAETKSDFVPVTVTSLTLRNCNMSTLSSSFTRTWSWLQYLDLSLNNLDTEYVGGAALKELNLSHNALAVFPAGSLNSSGLEALYIQGNDIKDFNVSQDQFEQIQRLKVFTANLPDSSSTCHGGAWQSAHGTAFCVLGASTTAAAPDSSRSSESSSDGDHDGLGLLTYWLIAGAIIVFFLLLLVTWQRRRHSRERENSPIVSPEAVEPTTPKYNANAAFNNTLNHDNAAATAPAAVAAVAAAAGAYPGYGRSHGNSVDSEDATAMGVSLAGNKVLTSCRLDYNEVTLNRCISRGGFGLVFVGSYRGRQVAVKKIRNERGVEREHVEQFVREISLISGLNHPRIVEFIGACWTTPAELSAVTELMERGDLRDVTRRFKRRGYRLSWETHKADIALHIAEALTYLHGLNPTVIHRDLKGKNVMLNTDMEAKLSDFGIARERSFYDGSEHMTVGIGTSFWIAPEVLVGRDYDERADIYSFGVVLSEIDTDDYPYWNAQHPPQGKVQENEILRLVARGAKRPAFSDDCPPAILELAARCLRADPEERPSASEIVEYLQQLVQDRNSSSSFSSMVRAGNSFDFNTNNNSPTRTAPANTIVDLRSSGQADQQKPAYSTGNRTKTTTTTTTTKVASSSVGASSATSYRPAAAEALAPAHKMVVSSPQVTHQVVRTKIAPKGKRTTTKTTATWRAEQVSAGSTTGGHFTTGTGLGNSDGDSRGVPSRQSHVDLTYAGPTSPTDLRNLNQQRQLISSSGEEAVGIDRRGQKWIVYDDVREL